MTRIAVLGLGAMGSRVARNLLTAGFDVCVYNRDAVKARALVEAGARSVATPRDAAKGAAVVISMVTDDRASESVWLHERAGAALSLDQGAIAIESSTLSYAWVGRLSGILAKRGIDFIDAPMFGSLPQAEARQLIYLAGAAEPVFERAVPVLSASSASCQRIGPAGHGTAVKLAINAMFAMQCAGWAELLKVLQQHQIDLPAVAESMLGTPVTSPAARAAVGLMLSDRHAPMFPIRLVAKDLLYALQMAGADRSGLLARLSDQFQIALGRGHGEEHISAICKIGSELLTSHRSTG